MIEVRRAGPGDAEELIRLRVVMMGAVPGGADLAGDWQRTGADMLRTQLAEADPPVGAFVVDKGDAPGLASCVLGHIDLRLPGPSNPTGLRGYVYNVATDPPYRRRGLSRACLTALMEWFAQREVHVIDLRASPEGEPLYASLGFVRTETPAMRFKST